MKCRTIAERALRVLEKLDNRLEGQTLKPGADAVHLTSVVGAFHTAAGRLERRIIAWPVAEGLSAQAQRSRVSYLAAELRILKRVVDTHAVMVRMRGLLLKNQPSALDRKLLGNKAAERAASIAPKQPGA